MRELQLKPTNNARLFTPEEHEELCVRSMQGVLVCPKTSKISVFCKHQVSTANGRVVLTDYTVVTGVIPPNQGAAKLAELAKMCDLVIDCVDYKVQEVLDILSNAGWSCNGGAC